MERRKKEEIEYYDARANEWLEDISRDTKERDFESFAPFLLGSYSFARHFLENQCQDKKILDYGCGNGIHSVWLAGYGGKVVGIDLSEKSLEIAKKRMRAKNLEARIEFLMMDCEQLEFPDNYFDIIFDGGAFSSLDFQKALFELRRVLKPEGFVIGIETFGHNPFTNLKRKINKITKKRTKWAVSHIIKDKDLELAKGYFDKIEVHYFHLISWLVFPFLNLPGGRLLLKSLEKIEGFLLFAFPLLRRYCFKIVFVFSKPRK